MHLFKSIYQSNIFSHQCKKDLSRNISPENIQNLFSPLLLVALGGLNNIKTCYSVPHSKRIRLTLVNPRRLNQKMIQKTDLVLFMRIGDKIIHIIP